MGFIFGISMTRSSTAFTRRSLHSPRHSPRLNTTTFPASMKAASDTRTTLKATLKLPSKRESGSWENTNRTATALRAFPEW